MLHLLSSILPAKHFSVWKQCFFFCFSEGGAPPPFLSGLRWLRCLAPGWIGDPKCWYRVGGSFCCFDPSARAPKREDDEGDSSLGWISLKHQWKVHLEHLLKINNKAKCWIYGEPFIWPISRCVQMHIWQNCTGILEMVQKDLFPYTCKELSLGDPVGG